MMIVLPVIGAALGASVQCFLGSNALLGFVVGFTWATFISWYCRDVVQSKTEGEL